MSNTPGFNPRRSSHRRGPSLRTLVFKMGGVSGAARRILFAWQHPFTLNQLKLELRRRHPELIPGDGQVEDVLERLIERNRLSKQDDGSFRHVQQLEEAA